MASTTELRRAKQSLAVLDMGMKAHQDLLLSTAADLQDSDPLKERIIDVLRRAWRLAYITRPDGSFVLPLVLRDRAMPVADGVAVADDWLKVVGECRNRMV